MFVAAGRRAIAVQDGQKDLVTVDYVSFVSKFLTDSMEARYQILHNKFVLLMHTLSYFLIPRSR